ncbi:unnamed protein product [Withania somnifera]
MQLLDEISQKGSKLDTITYNTILQDLFQVGRIGDAEKIYAKMLSAGSLRNYGFVEEAMSLFNMLERKRGNINIISYDVVINGLCKNGKLDEAHAIFEKLSSMGLPLNVRTYTAILNGFCRGGLLDEAKDMLSKMEDNGCLLDNVTYNVIVQGFLRYSRISEMTTFMKEITGRDFSCHATTAELLVKATNENPSALNMIPELHSNANE